VTTQPDPDIQAAFNDFNADTHITGDRYDSYEEYVRESVDNYEHLLRQIDPSVEGAKEESEAIRYWLDKLIAEDERLRPTCGACGQRHIPDDCDLDYEVIDLTVDLSVTIRSSEDPVKYVRNAMSFRDERGNSVTVTDVFRNDE
jgi:hypothetical protein